MFSCDVLDPPVTVELFASSLPQFSVVHSPTQSRLSGHNRFSPLTPSRHMLCSLRASHPPWHQVPADAASTHLAACLLAGEIDRARFLWKRSGNLHGDAQFASVWGVGRALWNKELVHGALTAAEGACTGMPQTLLGILRGELQVSTMALIAKGYETVSVKRAAELLGLSENEASQRCVAAGWGLNGGMLSPKVSAHVSKPPLNVTGLATNRNADLQAPEGAESEGVSMENLRL
jgi:hypothetical protein